MGGFYYPQASVILRVLWEDFKTASKAQDAKESTFPILCRSVRVNINDYAHADTFEAEIDYKNFPFDPRCIRSVGITVFMQDLKSVYESGNQLKQIEPSIENAVFQGFADEESIKFDDSKRTVKLEGRDFTGLFIDRHYPQGLLNLEAPVDTVLQTIIDQLPENVSDSKGIKKITLDNRIPDALPNLAQYYPENQDKLGAHKNVKKEETFWEIIQDVVNRCGLIAYVEFNKLVLTKPRVLYDKKKTVYFVYGNNLSNLEFKRKIGRRKTFNLVVRSLNTQTKTVLTAQIPLEATPEWSNATGIPAAEVKVDKVGPDGKPLDPSQAQPAPYIAFSVPNAPDKQHLINVGQEIYEEIGRQEIEGSFETSDMLTVHFDAENKNVNNSLFDITKLRIGTPVSIEITQDDLAHISRLTSESDRKFYLSMNGYPDEIASIFAQTIGKMATPFYTKSVEFTMDAESGFKTKVEFVNFIEIANRGF